MGVVFQDQPIMGGVGNVYLCVMLGLSSIFGVQLLQYVFIWMMKLQGWISYVIV